MATPSLRYSWMMIAQPFEFASAEKMAEDKDVDQALKNELMKSKKKKKKKIDIEAATADLQEIALKQNDEVGAPEKETINQEDKNDNELMLDLKGKKKKKPKKKIDLDADVQQLTTGIQEVKLEEGDNVDKSKEASAAEAVDKDLLDQLKGKKKKAKPKVTFEGFDAVESEEKVSASGSQSSALSALYYELPKKKKKKRPNVTFEGFDIQEVEAESISAEPQSETQDEELEELKQKMPWLETDRDYTYDELLNRAFRLITRNNPNMAGGRGKLVMKPPQVIRAGKKTSFANFTEICKLLHREPKHLMAFLMAELGTSGSIDGNNQLIIKGKFMQKQVESVLKRYIKEYVTCHTCRSPDTILQRESRLTFLQCESCGSRCSVQNIKSGFQAVTNRAQMRLRQN